MQDRLHQIDALIERGDIKKADIQIAKGLRAQLTPAQQALLMLRRARVRLLSARPEDALEDLSSARRLLNTDFETPENLELLADCLFARFELASVGFADRNFLVQAQQTYESILQQFERYPNLGWVYYQLGRIAIASNQIETATSHFQQALLSSSRVNVLTAYCYERLGFIAFYEWRDFEQALGFLNRAADTYPAVESRLWLAQVHLRRSRVLRQMGDPQAALHAAEMAQMLVSGAGAEGKAALAETQLTIAELLSSIGYRDREIVMCLNQFMQNAKRPLGVDVTWSRAHELLGDASFNLGQYDAAVLAYRAALQFNPDHPWEVSLLYRIARSYYQQRAYQETVETVRSMLAAAAADEQPVTDYRVYDLLGSAQFALGKYDQAASAYQRALEMAPPGADMEKLRQYLQYAREQV